MQRTDLVRPGARLATIVRDSITSRLSVGMNEVFWQLRWSQTHQMIAMPQAIWVMSSASVLSSKDRNASVLNRMGATSCSIQTRALM